jgi:hypothetical protein
MSGRPSRSAADDSAGVGARWAERARATRQAWTRPAASRGASHPFDTRSVKRMKAPACWSAPRDERAHQRGQRVSARSTASDGAPDRTTSRWPTSSGQRLGATDQSDRARRGTERHGEKHRQERRVISLDVGES